MKKSVKKMLVLAILGVTGLIAYCAMSSKRKLQTQDKRHDIPREKNHHTTNIFAKAKGYASEKD